MSDQQKLGLNVDNQQDGNGFEFEPIKGYPMLNWQGKRPFTSTSYYPAQLKEVHGTETGDWFNKLFWGDNLQVMSYLLREYRGKVQLAYIDPPFDSKADYKKKIRVRGKAINNEHGAFEEKQYTDIWTNDQYLQYMYERLLLIRELLSTTGVICVQCDTSRGHLLASILDEIFSRDCYVNTITWQRSHAHGNTGQGSKHFGSVTEYIHIYSKSSAYRFNPQYTPYSDEIIKRDYKYIDEITGEKYRLTPVDGPGGASKGNPFYEFLGVQGYYRYSKEKMQTLYDQDEIILSSTGKTLHRKRYLREAKGTPITDIWTDINRVSPTSRERLGYPTQKPEALLKRIINTFSDFNDLIFDCFMGSGTTQAVAMKLGRRFIGADINLGAIQITTKRLLGIARELDNQQPTLIQDEGEEPVTHYTGFEVYNVNHYDIFRNPLEAKTLLLEALEVQRLPDGHLFDGEKDGYMVKVMPVNRIATRQDLNPLITNFNERDFKRRFESNPNEPVERIMLICMGHEPDLKARLQESVHPYKLDVEVVDVLRDKSDLTFKRDSEAKIIVQGDELVIEAFYPMNLLKKLSLQKEMVEDWRELVESIMVDWNYGGAELEPTTVDIPEKKEMVSGRYPIPKGAGTIRVKITDLLSESLEVEV